MNLQIFSLFCGKFINGALPFLLEGVKLVQSGRISVKKKALGFLVVVAAIFIAAALFGALIQAAASSEEPVNFIVYFKEGAH